MEVVCGGQGEGRGGPTLNVGVALEVQGLECGYPGTVGCAAASPPPPFRQERQGYSVGGDHQSTRTDRDGVKSVPQHVRGP